MKIPITQQPNNGPAFDLAASKAVRLVSEVYSQLRSDPALHGTMCAAAVLLGGGIGALIENEMTDDEIAAFVVDIAAKARAAFASYGRTTTNEDTGNYDDLKAKVHALLAAGRLDRTPTREQRIDFAYGNAKIENDKVTREMAERAVDTDRGCAP